MPLSSESLLVSNDALRTYDTSAGDNTWQEVGDAFTNPVRLIKFKNDSDVDIYISYDGSTTHDIILSGDREVEDLCSNKTNTNGWFRRKGVQLYAKSASGTGNFYITVLIGIENE